MTSSFVLQFFNFSKLRTVTASGRSPKKAVVVELTCNIEIIKKLPHLKSSNMILFPSCPRAASTIEGEEYASLVTQVQWNTNVVRKIATIVTITVAICRDRDIGIRVKRSDLVNNQSELVI